MNKITNNIKIYKVVLISILAALLLSFFVLYTPRIVLSNVEDKFSATRAAQHIEVISRKPHSYYDQTELAEVRQYIKDTLISYVGVNNVSDFKYDKEDVVKTVNNPIFEVPYDVNNVMGKIQGKTDKGILLVSHYDSQGPIGYFGDPGRSYGALDDGYGVGTMLELAYLLKDETPSNSIYFLFTDAEEVGLFGAHMASKDPRVMDNAKFIINLESRGQFGPAYMFETSRNNAKVMELYKKAKLPTTYSLATAVYNYMPNGTDFTPFKDQNLPGINFAVLAGLEYYHAPIDKFEDLNYSTLQHMGVQTEPIVREFMNNSKYVEDGYFDAKTDLVFFTLFAGILVSYSQITAIVIAILILLVFGFILTMSIKKKEINQTIVTKTLPKGLLLSTILLVATFAYSFITAFLGKKPFVLTYTRIENANILALLMIVVATFVLIRQIFKYKNNHDIFILGLAINVLLTVVITFIFPGGSFLFAVTSIVGLVAYSIKYINNSIIKNIIYIISYGLLLIFIMPILWTLYHALTIGGLVVVVLILILNAIVTVPIIVEHCKLIKNKS